MKYFLITLCLLLAQLLYSQDTLQANRLKILKDDSHRIINKTTNPLIIVLDENTFKMGNEPNVTPVSVNIIKLVGGGKKITYYLFNAVFLKGIAYYNKEGKLVKFGLLDLKGTWFMFYIKIFRT